MNDEGDGGVREESCEQNLKEVRGGWGEERGDCGRGCRRGGDVGKDFVVVEPDKFSTDESINKGFATRMGEDDGDEKLRSGGEVVLENLFVFWSGFLWDRVVIHDDLSYPEEGLLLGFVVFGMGVEVLLFV
jgi:hypothetical protein